MSEQVSDLVKAKNMLKDTRKRLNKIKKISLLNRGHEDNENKVKLEIREKHLKDAVKLLKKKESIDGIPVAKEIKKKKKPKIKYNGEYP